jgi:predicted transposase
MAYRLLREFRQASTRLDTPPLSPRHHPNSRIALERFNAACDVLAAIAFWHRCANKVELQKLAYHDIRRRFGLSAHMTVRAIAKVYKQDKNISRSSGRTAPSSMIKPPIPFPGSTSIRRLIPR